jgi:hypothetical protein
MSPPELPISKTESRRALWAAGVIIALTILLILAILIAPSGPHDKPGTDSIQPAAADPTANGAMTGRTTPVVP